MHLIYKKMLLPTSRKNKTSDSIRDLNVFAMKPRDTKTVKALFAKDKMPNKTQTKERIREGKEKATLFSVSLQPPGWKRKGGGRGKQLPVKNSCVILGPDQIGRIGSIL